MSIKFELSEDNKLRIVQDLRVISTIAPSKTVPKRLYSLLTLDERLQLDAKLVEQRERQKLIFMRDNLLNLPTLAHRVAAQTETGGLNMTEHQRERLLAALELLIEKISIRQN